MFSGIVEEVGVVEQVLALGEGVEFVIRASRVLTDLKVEDSISVQGVCLTVVGRDAQHFRVQAIEQTLSKTSLGQLTPGSGVNLERALLATTRLGGHIVQGHVDGVGTVREINQRSTSHEIRIAIDPQFNSLIVHTGSICLDGISLTLAEVGDAEFMVAIIPHTWNETTISNWSIGSRVNLEFDIVGKYIQRMVGLGMKVNV